MKVSIRHIIVLLWLLTFADISDSKPTKGIDTPSISQTSRIMERLPSRVFADISNGKDEDARWREFRNYRQKEQSADEHEYYTTADVWIQHGKTVGARFSFSSPSGDWVNLVDYIFRYDGSLQRATSSLRTFYTAKGKMIRIERIWHFNAQGRVLKKSTRFFDEKGRAIKPVGYHRNVPSLYKMVSNLPFYGLLKRPRPKS